MARTFKDALKHRRTYYSISNGTPIPDREIEEIIEYAVTHVPSAFNSQTARLVLLLGKEHRKLWEIVKGTLRAIIPVEDFAKTERKIDVSFASGYGTVLYFEDMSIVHQLQNTFPSYKDKFPVWSDQTSAMHQFAIWTMLEDVGFGASLQHYNPLIDEKVKKEWHLPESWKLNAEMPFGIPVEIPGEKEYQPLEERVKVFKS